MAQHTGALGIFNSIETEDAFVERKATEYAAQRLKEDPPQQGETFRSGHFRRKRLKKLVEQDVQKALQGPEGDKMRLGQSVQTRFGTIRTRGDYDKMSPDEQGNLFNKLVAEEAAKVNMGGIAGQASAAYVAKRDAAIKEKSAQEKLHQGIAKENKEAASVKREWELGEIGMVEQPVYFPDSGTPYRSHKGGIQLPSGNLVINGTTHDAGTWTTTAPAGRNETLSERVAQSYTPGAQQKVRDKVSAFAGFVNEHEKILKTIEDAYTDDGNLFILGASGAATNTIVSVANNIATFYRQLGEDEYSTAQGGGGLYDQKSGDKGDRIEAVLKPQYQGKNVMGAITGNYEPTSQHRQRFNAQMSSLAYSVALMFNQRVTNADYDNALKIVAAGAHNPAVLQRVFTDSLKRGYDKVTLIEAMAGTEAWRHMTGAGWTRTKKRFEDFMDVHDPASTHYNKKVLTLTDGIKYPYETAQTDGHSKRLDTRREAANVEGP